MKIHILLLSLFSLSISARSQTILTCQEIDSIMNLNLHPIRYVDFHIHTTMKNYYNQIPSPQALGNGKFISEKVRLMNWSGRAEGPDNKFNHFKSYRQADWGKIAESNASILCTSFTPIEKRLTSKVFPKPPLPVSLRWITGNLVTHLGKKRLKSLNRKTNSSFDEFYGEYRFMLMQDTQQPMGKNHVSPVKNKNDLIRNYTSGNSSLVLTLEGAHIFHGDGISSGKKYNDPLMDKEEQDEILQNIDSIKNLPYRVFFVTPAHFCWNGMVGSAKSIDMDDWKRALLLRFSYNENFRSKVFLKFADGIIRERFCEPKHPTQMNCGEVNHCKGVRDTVKKTEFGDIALNRLLSRSGRHNARVLIDVKHMDMKARLQYYHIIDSLRKVGIKDIPIIASHVAVNGKSIKLNSFTGLFPISDVYEEVKDPAGFYQNQVKCGCITPKDYDLETINWFYPWSINLATEEISIIYNSDGIIGLTLEERVLGSGQPNYKVVGYKDSVTRFIQSKGYSLLQAETFWQMQPMFRNIFHIIEYSGRNDKTAWDHLSIGSDFDGIMKPVQYCRTASEIPTLHELLKEFLPCFAEMTKKESLMFGLSSNSIADKIIFKNGERFILKYF